MLISFSLDISSEMSLFNQFKSNYLRNLHTIFLEKAMATHSSTLSWKITWMEEPGRLQSVGLRRVRHDWVTSLTLFTFMHWRRKWQPTPVFLPGESQGQGSLVGCCLWGHRVGHDWCDLAAAAAYYFPSWRGAWQPIPVFLSGESNGQKSLAGYSPRGCRESDTTEWLTVWCRKKLLVLSPNCSPHSGSIPPHGLALPT